MLVHIQKKTSATAAADDESTTVSSGRSKHRRKNTRKISGSGAVSINTSRTLCYDDAAVTCSNSAMESDAFEVTYEKQTYVIHIKDGAEEFLHSMIQLYDIRIYTSYPLALARAIVGQANDRCWAAKTRRKVPW